MMKNKKLNVILFIVLLAVSILASLWFFDIVRAHLEKSNSGFARKNHAPLPVRLLKVEIKPVSSTVVTQANLVEAQELPLYSISDAFVESVNVEVGSLVKKGDVLVVYKSDLIKEKMDLASSLLEIAKDEYAEAESNSKQIKDLYKRNVVAKDEFIKAALAEKKAKSKLINAQYDLVNAKLELSQVVLQAPSGGIITEVNVFADSVARKNTPVVTISVTSPIYVEAKVAQRYFSDLRLGQKLKLNLDALPNQSFDADLVRIGYEIDQKNNTLSVYAKLNNPDLTLRPGMAGVATLDLSADTSESIGVPAIALIGNNGRNAYVFKVDKFNIARLTPVDIAGYEKCYVGVKAGLKAGDKIVIVGQQALMDGDKVEVGNDP